MTYKLKVKVPKRGKDLAEINLSLLYCSVYHESLSIKIIR